jgi:hypothetical protein
MIVSKILSPFILTFFVLSFLVQGAEIVKPCVKQTLVDSLIVELVKDVENLSRHKAKKLAVELILRQCQHEKDNGRDGIRIRDGKVKFSEFSNTYDTKDPVFFCKNNAGYKSYLSRMAQKLIQFSTKKQVPRKEVDYKRRPSSQRSKPIVKKKEAQWDCRIPNYIKTVRRVSRAQMETLSITYGAKSCLPVN